VEEIDPATLNATAGVAADAHDTIENAIDVRRVPRLTIVRTNWAIVVGRRSARESDVWDILREWN